MAYPAVTRILHEAYQQSEQQGRYILDGVLDTSSVLSITASSVEGLQLPLWRGVA